MQTRRFLLSLFSVFFVLGAVALAPLTAQAAKCNWTVKGKLDVDHQLAELKQAYGTSALENVQIKVSAKHKVLGAWGTWNSWPIVRTKADGSWSVTQKKNCAKRRFKVEVKFQDDVVEVRHRTATSSTTKVKWYTILDETSGSHSSGTFNLGTKTFKAGGARDLKDDEARAHADIWVLYKLAAAKAASFGSAYKFTTKIKVKYPHNSAVAPDSSEASYANPTTKVIYIFRSNDGTQDHFKVSTLLHELGHIWAYNHTSGEICLTETLVTTFNTHGTVNDPCVAFHEGWAEYFADEMKRALFGGTKTLPYARPMLVAKGLDTKSKVQHNDDGWWSVFHTLSTPDLHKYEFGTASSSTPNNRITATAAPQVNCSSPNISFKQMMSVFNAGNGYDKLSRSDTTIAKFFDRAAARLSNLSSSQSNSVEKLVNPASTVQPRDEFCSPLTPTPITEPIKDPIKDSRFRK
ncbi:MAG: hypothetical protein R6X02_35195 [Enhygromyxa sp.]